MLKKISLKLFGGLTEKYVDYFDSLKTSLKKGKVKYTIHEYLSIIAFVSLLTFIVSLIANTIVIGFTFPYPEYIYTLSIILALVFSGVAFALTYLYPSLKAKGIRSRIDKALPFAAFYMTTSASSGVNPVEIFRVLSLRGGAVGEEARKIYTNVKTLGMDLTGALQKTALSSPSPAFADLLWGMMSVVSAGGDIEGYLKGKTEALMAQYRRSLSDYAKAITLYTEIYITLVIVGSLLFIVLMSIISPLIGMNVLHMQTFLVFFFVPLVSVGYIMLLKSTSPQE